MIGELYERSLAGLTAVEIEHGDGRRAPLGAERWFDELPGDASLLACCAGPTLDVGSGPGRLTAALARRGVPALGIDVTAHAVALTRRAGALALHRDVFDSLPGAGRWHGVLLADGNVGIGGDPASLLGRVAQLLDPGGRALVEVEPPGQPVRHERVRLRRGEAVESWFAWAFVGADDIETVANPARLSVHELWTDNGRWFAALGRDY